MRKYLYPVFIVIFLGLAVAIYFFKKDAPVPALKERQGRIALGSEWLNTKKAIQTLQTEIRQNPNSATPKLALAQAYMQEARVTGDHGYYDKTALGLLDEVLKKEPNNFEALCCKSTVLLSQHHFTESLDLANKALAINPNNSFVYGLLCDAYLELGNYPKAVEMADKMVSMRPDLRSYSRVSYLREIHGDNAGAIEAMKLALSAGVPGLEQTEWIRTNLGQLYENVGDLKNAEANYQMALAVRPFYPFALAGLGRIAKANKDYSAAIKHFTNANETIIEYSFADELTDLYRLNNEPAKAMASGKRVIQMLGEGAGEEGDEGHGHYADRELAYAYLKINDTESALKHALLEYERRPENNDVNQVLAWVYYKKGDYKKAQKMIAKAMRTNSQNPVLLTHAGLIHLKAGDENGGLALLKKAKTLNPYLIIDGKMDEEHLVALQ